MAEGTAHEGKIRRVKRILYPLVKIIAYAGSSAEGYPKEIKIFFFLFLIDKSEVVNLELEVLKMKIIIIFIDLLMATVLFFVGRFFIKSRNTERSVLFLSGDYTGLNTEKICRVTGKRIKTWAMLFCLGGIIDFIKPGAGIIIVSVFFIILLVFHLVDMTINRDKYRV